jgi:hypothetical protein
MTSPESICLAMAMRRIGGSYHLVLASNFLKSRGFIAFLRFSPFIGDLSSVSHIEQR